MRHLFYIVLLLACFSAPAQKPSTVPPVPNTEALKKTTRAQLEAFKQQMLKQASMQAKAVSNPYNLKVNETDYINLETPLKK
ncbi:MAG TPA: hypothetical protein VEY10_07345 [Flavisolibacter sp.]|jgi:hypothetical protein|nr:hypothetical protein [Flavisolibacter sp.]